MQWVVWWITWTHDLIYSQQSITRELVEFNEKEEERRRRLTRRS